MANLNKTSPLQVKEKKKKKKQNAKQYVRKIVINNVQKNIRGAVIMDEVSITLHKGEIFALVGAAGSGKTLLSKIVLDLVKKSRGQVSVAGNVGAVLRQQNFRSATGLGVLKYCEVLGTKIITRSRKVNTLNMVGLKKIMHERIETYTASELARLRIAVAIVSRPEILVLDEPFKDLLPGEAREIRFILKSLADKEGLAILVTTENLNEIEEICDTIGIIDDGMLVAVKSYNSMIADDEPYSKISVTTTTPNLAAMIIEQKLDYEVQLCGPSVIVNAMPDKAQIIADELQQGGITILKMQRVNRPLQEQYYQMMAIRKGFRGGVM